MRTTLSLEEDVAVALERLRRNRDESFKDLVNEALRRGLQQMNSRPAKRERFVTATADLGRARISDLDDIAGVLGSVEGDAFR